MRESVARRQLDTGCSTTDTEIALCGAVQAGGWSTRRLAVTQPLTNNIIVLNDFFRMNMEAETMGGCHHARKANQDVASDVGADHCVLRLIYSSLSQVQDDVHAHEKTSTRLASLQAIISAKERRDAAPPPDVTRYKV